MCVARDARHETYFEANQHHWEQTTGIHAASTFYDLEGFVAGQNSLMPVELEELAPLVAGKSLLHLQCHLGTDTLSLARLGATVTGVDFSAASIEVARKLAADCGLDARFVEANVYDAPEALQHEQFDIVYVGVGSLVWLPDVRAWASVVAQCLAPGGLLYLYDGHPLRGTLEYGRDDELLVIAEPYFEQTEPTMWEGTDTYTDGPPLQQPTRSYEWNHGLGEIVTAVAAAGLHVEALREHREVPWPALPFLEAVPGVRMWRLPERAERMPMMYSLLAKKPAV